MRLSISILPIVINLLFLGWGEGASPDSVEFFEKQIRPVLAEKCYKCHAADSEKLKGGLQVDHREHLLAGGETGPVIEPGNADDSLLIESLRYKNPDLQMPPKEKLSKEVVEDFERWVAAGAVWPDEPVPLRDGASDEEGFDLEKRRAEHWSWRPVKRYDLPETDDAEWSREDLDHFVLRGMESLGLRPAEEAAKSVWLRRVYFDLIGLPPSPEQIAVFEEDTSERAYEKVVDGLLASPRFGEKWARHWMDLVRYAETYGHEFDYPIQHAYEYRDYLIRAFNADVPYDELITEHIAGDLISDPRRHPEEGINESILGTAFWYLHEATHAPTDVLTNEADIMDNQIDVFGKAFLGLTISCARCHDHKFDAISTADYYAMTAYIHSSARQVVPLDVNGSRSVNLAKQRALKKQADAKAGPVKPPVLTPIAPDEQVFEDFSGGRIPEGWSTTGLAFSGSGEKGGVRLNSDDPVSYPGMVDSGLLGKERVGTLRTPTFTLESKAIHIRAKGSGVAIRAIMDNYQMTKFNALLFRGTSNEKVDTKGKFQWITLSGNLDKYVGHKIYLEFADEGNGDLVIDEIRFSDGKTPKNSPSDSQSFDVDVMKLVKRGAGLARQLPEARFAVAMAEGTPEEARVYVRGSHRTLGEEVPKRFLTALGGREGDRLALAAEVASAENPLTSRVMANRLWHYLFGRGLVPTVDDFGPMGQMPSHPELLDWLAADLIEKDWSIKSMIRKIVLSATYRQSSQAHPDLSPELLAEVDPSNEMLSRMPVKRLTGEAIRDSILTVSGQMDESMFGPSIPTHRTEFMTGRGGRKSGPLDGAGRRSIYGSVYRNFLSPFMLTYDVPNPFGPKGRRSVSNVPAQALVMMNDPFVAEQSERWAESVLSEGKEVSETLNAMYLSALGRLPNELEATRMFSYIDSETASGAEESEVWANVGHVLMNMKEFIFVY